ncbi:MAG: HAMP domain-containing histidine kinase [Steroidobacteraceae bacterium]|nr:HAMP domain-containing histidine kinase [Steroidobacteraceae bacterium]
MVDRQLSAMSLHEGIRKLAAANPQIDIYLLDDTGAIVASSVPEIDWRRSRVDLTPIKTFIDGGASPILADDPRSTTDRRVFSAASFHVADCPGDYLYLVLGRTDDAPGAVQLRNAFAVREGASFVVLAAALSVALSLVLLRLLTRRLSVLEATMARFGRLRATGPASPANARGGDEVDRLEALFRDLAARIEAQIAQLQAVDTARREMLANLSHDLRTPLTTLLAHLETLQIEGARLSEQEHREFVDVAMRQSQRISRLIEQLLEAAKLEAGQVTVEPESLPVGELLQDVVQKFAIAARDRGVAINAEVSEPDLRVYADIALLERVLDNLIENALRHTPAGGRVTVCAAARPGCVRLSVEDNGPGMTAEAAARIFDRFYRGDAGRSTNGGQAGLGLAIVKSILDLHGATIDVVTQPGRGAKFQFDLPATTTD